MAKFFLLNIDKPFSYRIKFFQLFSISLTIAILYCKNKKIEQPYRIGEIEVYSSFFVLPEKHRARKKKYNGKTTRESVMKECH